jgi:PAS domain S-box-containing protein
VQQFQKLNKDEIGTSNFNLNMEKGKIQLPKRPVARLGMKVYDNNGQERGLIILNICLRTFFANLDKTILYDVFLLDNKGKFLHHHDKRYGIIGDQNYTIFDMIPTLNNNILNEEIYLEKHLFITKLNLFNNTQDIRIVLKNKFIAQGEKTHEMQEKFVIAYIIFAIILLPLALYFSKRPDELTKDIKEKMDVISQNVIYSRTDKSGKIVDVSDAFCKLSGYSKEELIGSSHNIIRHPDSSKELFEDMWEKLLSFKAWRGEIKNKKKDGGYYWVFSDIQPKFNNKGEHIGYISVRSDITDRKNFEHQQLEMLEQSKMAAMGEMIGNIAHQWRQPLSVITTVASGVAFKQENNVLKIEDIPKDMDHIVQSAEYLSDTIETFRNFLKEKKERKDICIQDRVLEVLSILSATIKNYDLRIIDNISDTEPITINMVAGELEQVIINILNNSKDVFIEKEIDDRWIKLDLQKYEDKIVFTIEDNGGGIPEHILPKIFEAYFTTKHKSKGTGLGLNMSYRIVTESFNGKLYVNNTRNGAKFFIEIPFS